MYNCLRNKSRLCRKALGNQEHAQLVDKDAVRIYILWSLAFNAIFTDNCIAFGSLYFLELHMPTEFDLVVILGDVLSASKIIHLNLLCGHRHDYWQELHTPSWTPFLGRLLILRIKYIRWIEEASFNCLISIVYAHSFFTG